MQHQVLGGAGEQRQYAVLALEALLVVARPGEDIGDVARLEDLGARVLGERIVGRLAPADERQPVVAENDRIPGSQRHRGVHASAIQERAVLASEILEGVPAVGFQDLRMMAGEKLIGQKDIIIVRPPDRNAVLGDGDGLERTVGRTNR